MWSDGGKSLAASPVPPSTADTRHGAVSTPCPAGPGPLGLLAAHLSHLLPLRASGRFWPWR